MFLNCLLSADEEIGVKKQNIYIFSFRGRESLKTLLKPFYIHQVKKRRRKNAIKEENYLYSALFFSLLKAKKLIKMQFLTKIQAMQEC